MPKDPISGAELTAFGSRAEVIDERAFARELARLDELALLQLKGTLAALMDLRGISSRELSRRARVPIGSVLEAVNGRRKPSVGKLIAYASALNVTVDQLLGPSAGDSLVAQARADVRSAANS